MDTLQIEDIKSRDGTLLHWSVDAAAALASCGFRIRHKRVEKRPSGETEDTWFVDGRPHEARDLLLRAAILSGKDSLSETAPEHPLFAGLYALRCLRALRQWTQLGNIPVVLKPSSAGRLLVMQMAADPNDLMPIAWATENPAHDVALAEPSDFAFCAAAAVCGFLPYPRLTGQNVPHLHFAHQSLTFPDLTLPRFQQPDLPGGPHGARHPFGYALTACLQSQAFATLGVHGRRRTALLRSRVSPRTAMISTAILDDTGRDTAAARQEIEDHLAAA